MIRSVIRHWSRQSLSWFSTCSRAAFLFDLKASPNEAIAMIAVRSSPILNLSA